VQSSTVMRAMGGDPEGLEEWERKLGHGS
jgi:hypothetical protein